AIAAARERLGEFGDRIELRIGSYTNLGLWLGEGVADGVLFDLGVSSYHLESSERGFSFQLDGPLDMRFDRRQPLTAAQLINSLGEAELERIFWELGGERRARAVARMIVLARGLKPIERTTELAELVARVVPRTGMSVHPATRVFQALRIKVNDELGSLRRGLDAAWRVLRRGGRLAVICFHSGEERVVREFGRALVRDYEVEGDVDVPELRRPRPPLAVWVTKKAIRPAAEEVAANPRSRSARMRVLEKL
ncbi:MAG: 16S rRNA (cytosine(1402)-N(4))-methyltransferase RsmH, partial [Verrucomicrobiae bacterium]|nr:16S rRNA (cytosine(1402)-N(4))-methyltransferase RsmH [Verrucomicrobiae bacterium]